jgi:L-ascorbate metabolism protein UlaG (beta-lactamase superfamily)
VITLTWVGHATVVIDLDGVRLLTDPLLRNHSGPLRRTTPLPREQTWQGADAVLVSHLHHDHAEPASLRLADAPRALTSAANAAWLRRIGVRGEGLDPSGWRAVHSANRMRPGAGEVEVSLVRADHRNRPMPHRPNDAHGHLVRGASGVVWFAGDTSVFDELQDLPALAGAAIDLALVPIGGWGPRLSPGHMGPREAAQACALVGARAVLPIHFGTFHPLGFHLASLSWMHRPLEAFTRELAEQSPSTRLIALAPGGTADLA